MKKQLTFSLISDELAQARTSKKEFLEKIERIIPFDEWIGIIRPCYYKGEHGNKPYDLELMLRIFLLQNLYDLSDMKVMNEVIDSRAFSDFCGVDSPNQVSDGDTIGRFRNILVENGLQEKLFHQVIDILSEKCLILKRGTIVDSTLIAAPSSTKNKDKKRDKDAHSVKKGTQWHFGYKAHIGVDKDSGLVHHLKAKPHKFLKSSKKRYNISMNKQLTFSLISDELAQARTSKKEFLEKIERIIPFDEWIEIIRPCYYKGERGNKPYGLELMLRIYLLQNLYDLSDMKAMTEVIDSRAFSDFCGVDSPNQVPDGDTIGRFRNILVENGLQEKLFHQVIDILSKKGLILKRGTIVDSTLIAAPSSTKKQG